MEAKSNKLQAKDLINVGIFTAIYFVIFFAGMMLGYIPIFIPLLGLVCPILCGKMCIRDSACSCPVQSNPFFRRNGQDRI